jgi:hypothetical protein
MFLRSKIRRKDGKEHRSWSVVENRRVAGGRVVQRHVLYLGEINSTQELAWRRSIEVMEAGTAQPRTLSLFAEDPRPLPHPPRRAPSASRRLRPWPNLPRETQTQIARLLGDLLQRMKVESKVTTIAGAAVPG